MSEIKPGTQDWLDQVDESVVDPDRPIIDPHHHLWRDRGARGAYELTELWADTESGHRIEKTVFVECHASYREEGPEHLRPLGETEYVAGIAAESAKGPGATIAGIVSHADLTLGDEVEEVLAGHEEVGRGLFRGIRHSGARDPHPESLTIPGRAPEGLYEDTSFRQGMVRLGAMGYSYDTWHYHHQNAQFAELARAVPDTPMVLDHFGTPLGVGPYAGKHDEIFERWKLDMAKIAECENVVAKIGGLAMPDNGFGWNLRATPATSDEIVEAQARYYLHTIECFGVDRCLMESNFPVDKMSVSYRVLYNALKKMVADFSGDEKHALFYGNAERVYRL